MSSTMKKEQPIFSKNKVNFTPVSPITHLCVSNNKVVIVMQNKVVIKIDLKNPGAPTEIDLKNHNVDAKLSNMYMDPSGQHIILTFSPKDSANPAEVFYLGPKLDKPKEIPALKSHIITAVAWNQNLESYTASTTSPFLLATSKGSIFEAEIVNSEVRNAKLVYDIGKGTPAVVSGLEFFFQPKTNNIYILVATSKRLYQFKGSLSYMDERPWFSNIFNAYINQSSEEYYREFGPPSPTGFKVISENTVSRLHIHYFPGVGFPSTIAYLTDNGVMVYNFVTNRDCVEDDFLGNLKIVSYPKTLEGGIENSSQQQLPKSVVATDFHVLLLSKGQVNAVCILSDEVIFEDIYPENNGRLLNIIRDPMKGTIWCFTEKLIFKYAISDEDRNIWSIFLEKGDFIKAQEYSKHDPEKLQAIAMKQADNCFANGEYDMSAMYYALTKASFEEIALKFVDIENSHALKTFLMKKMSSLKSHDVAKTTALVLWLVEIFLNDLGTLRDFGKQDTAEYKNVDAEFLNFMSQPLVKECVSKSKKAVYDLMASHGDKENLIHFTLVMKDYDEVIENNINNRQYQAALSTLLKQKDASLYSRFIPILLDKDPVATIDALITAGRMLSPIKLLPKFSSKLDSDIAAQVTRYLEHCINNLKIQDQSVHDYLVSLYIHYYPSERLLEYLENQGMNVHTIRYDPKYALMMCLEKEMKHPSIHLYTLMGLYEEAVTMAIKVDLQLAKKVANVPEDDISMKKKLWLKIAKHVVKEKNDIQQAMDFLQQCDLLKIEDILPFFPDFVTIDHFKDAICSSLHEYNQHIQNLKYEMDEATKSAETITEEIHAVRNRCAVIRATDQCTVCENILLIRNFYVFPCSHKFHADCLLSEIYPTFTEPRKKLLQEHQKKLNEVTKNQDVMSTGSGTAVISARDQIKADIDEIVASECIYCGDTMLKLVDVPFIPEDDYMKIQREWE